MHPERLLPKSEQLRRLGIRGVCRRCGAPERSGEFIRENKSVRDVQRALIGEGLYTLDRLTDDDIKHALCR